MSARISERQDLGLVGSLDGGENVIGGPDRGASRHAGMQDGPARRAFVVNKVANQSDLGSFDERSTSRHSQIPFAGPSKGEGTVRQGLTYVNRWERSFPLADKYILANAHSPHIACAAIILGLALVALS